MKKEDGSASNSKNYSRALKSVWQIKPTKSILHEGGEKRRQFAPQIKTINTHRREIKRAAARINFARLRANAQECAQCYFAVEFYGFDLAHKG